MKYLLDSNAVSDIYNASSVNHHQIINKLLSLEEDDDIFISVLTLYEFEYAFANSPDNKKLTIKKTIAQIKQDFNALPLSVHGSEAFGELKKRFKELQSINNENIKNIPLI
jgi:predicted nucleic acid-binding protein